MFVLVRNTFYSVTVIIGFSGVSESACLVAAQSWWATWWWLFTIITAEPWWVIELGGGRVIFSLCSGQAATGKNSQTKAGET